MWEALCSSRKAWSALLLVSLVGCGGGKPTELRTLGSGRQIEVDVHLVESEDGRVLLYAYTTHDLRDQSEWVEVVLIAQREADRAKAQKLVLVADDNSFLNFITRDRARTCAYERDGDTWRAMPGGLRRC
jgi:hypothetical protein